MMNLNPLFFDKTFLEGKKNLLSSSNNTNKTYLFSDIIKVCEEELDANQLSANSSEKEILLDVNDLKNLTITKSNKETVEGIQQAIELLENIALISNSSAVNINSAHITSKIFILDKENLELFFDKINESLRQKDFANTGDYHDSKIVYLNEKETKNNLTVSSNSSEYNFIGFNPEAIISSIDNKDIFSVSLKTNGEKLTLTISSTEPSNESKTKLNKKLQESKSKDNLIALNKYLNNDVVLDNFYELEKTKKNFSAEQNLTTESQADKINEEKYYKLEVIHTSFDNNNFIYSPDKDVETKFIKQTSLLDIDRNTETKVPDSSEEINNSKIAGIINPVKSNKTEDLNSIELNKVDEASNSVKYTKPDAEINLSQSKENKITVNDESAHKDFNKESTKPLENSTQILNKGNSISERNIQPSGNSIIDFNLLTEGKFTKAKVIKDTTDKDITQFNPEVIDKKQQVTDKNVSNQVNREFVANEIENKLNELNIESIRIEVKKNVQRVELKTSVSAEAKPNSNDVNNNQNIISGNAEQIKEPQPEKLIESFSKSSLKSFLNENKKNQTSDVDEKTKSININKAEESKKIDVSTNTNQINLSHKSNEIVDNQPIRINEIKVSKSESPSEGNFSKDSKNENDTKKNLHKADSIANDLDKNINKSEQVVTKEPLKNYQINTHENSNQKVELPDNQLNVLKSKVQNEFGSLKESLKVINANQIADELSKYINSGNKQSITFQLSPENLGKLTLSIDYIENQLRANIEVENEQVKQLIQNNIEQLKNSLQSSGIQLNDVNVSLGNYEQKSLRNSNIKKKSYSKSYGKEVKVENSKAPSTKKMMGYNTYDYLI